MLAFEAVLPYVVVCEPQHGVDGVKGRILFRARKSIPTLKVGDLAGHEFSN
jgi:hypothetical protein